LGDESFQAITRTGTDNSKPTAGKNMKKIHKNTKEAQKDR